MLVIVGMISALIVSGISPAWAGPVVKREKHQSKRIAQGVKSGELTRGETRRLVQGERRIERERQRFLKDGELSDKEKAKLHHDLAVQSHSIYKQKHDAQTRPAAAATAPATAEITQS